MNISMKTGRVSFNAEEVKDMHGSLRRARDILDAFEKGLHPVQVKADFISFDIFTYKGYMTSVCAASASHAVQWAVKTFGGHEILYRAVVTK